MNIYIFKNKKAASKYLAKKLDKLVNSKPHVNLGLASGKTFILLYQMLGKFSQRNHTSWKHVSTYNLDEFVGTPKKMKHSCWQFMQNNLFSRVNISQNNIHFPPSKLGSDFVPLQKYDREVFNARCDIHLLGLGVNGHIGFNEPYALNNGKSSIVELTKQTIATKADYFYNGDTTKMTNKVVTVGINTILELSNTLLCAFGKPKAEAVGMLLGLKETTDGWPVQFLRSLPNFCIIVDKACFNEISVALNVKQITIKYMDE